MCAVYDYCSVNAQAQKNTHDSEVAQKRLPETVSKVAKAVVKFEDVPDVANATEFSHRSPETLVALEALLWATMTVCRIYSEDFRNPHMTHKLRNGEDLFEGDKLLFCNFLYDVCLLQGHFDSDRNETNSKNAKAFCDFAENVLNRGRPGYNFRFDVQFSTWWRRFRARMEKMKDSVGETEVF